MISPRISFPVTSLLIGAVGLLLLPYPQANAQIKLSKIGVAVREDFDEIGVKGSDAPLPAFWRADQFQSDGGNDQSYPVRKLGDYHSASGVTTRRAGNETSNSAGIINYGAGDPATATDRAVGFMSNSNPEGGTQSGNLYACFENGTTESITAVSLAYDVEKYRMGRNEAGYRIELYYSRNGSDWQSAGEVFTVSFGPDTEDAGYASAPGVVVPVSGILRLSEPIPVGESLYLAWNYSVVAGNYVRQAQGLAIDNFSLTPLSATAEAGSGHSGVFH